MEQFPVDKFISPLTFSKKSTASVASPRDSKAEQRRKRATMVYNQLFTMTRDDWSAPFSIENIEDIFVVWNDSASASVADSFKDIG